MSWNKVSEEKPKELNKYIVLMSDGKISIDIWVPKGAQCFAETWLHHPDVIVGWQEMPKPYIDEDHNLDGWSTIDRIKLDESIVHLLVTDIYYNVSLLTYKPAYNCFVDENSIDLINVDDFDAHYIAFKVVDDKLD